MKYLERSTATPQIVDTEALNKAFAKFPEEIRWGDYCNVPGEWIAHGVRTGNLIPLYTPSEYAKEFGVNEPISDDISIEDFDIIVADGYGFWNYPLDEYDIVKENCKFFVVVQFAENIRYVETGKEIRDVA